MFDQEFLNKQKEKLEQRRQQILSALQGVAKPDTSHHAPGDFNATYPNYGSEEAENAQEFVQFEQNIRVEADLERDLQNVTDALKKIENGTYGVCEKTGEMIPRERLEAFPEARTRVGV